MKRVSYVALIAGFFLFSAQVVPVQAVPVQQRLRQEILINDQQAERVTVIQNGQVQSFTYSAPQPYTTLDSSTPGTRTVIYPFSFWGLRLIFNSEAMAEDGAIVCLVLFKVVCVRRETTEKMAQFVKKNDRSEFRIGHDDWRLGTGQNSVESIAPSSIVQPWRHEGSVQIDHHDLLFQ